MQCAAGSIADMFQAFDRDRSEAIDMAAFREEMKQVLLGITDGPGALAVQMVLEDDNFLKLAADLELSASMEEPFFYHTFGLCILQEKSFRLPLTLPKDLWPNFFTSFRNRRRLPFFVPELLLLQEIS